MKPQKVPTYKRNWNNLSESSEGSKGNLPKQKKILSTSLTAAQRDELQVGEVVFQTTDYFSEKRIMCSREVRDIRYARSMPSASDGYTSVQWKAESTFTSPVFGVRTCPLKPEIVGRNLVLAEDPEPKSKSIIVCQKNGSSFDSIIIPTMSNEKKWSVSASDDGHLLGLVNDQNWLDDNRKEESESPSTNIEPCNQSESSNEELEAPDTNIELWDLSGSRVAGIQPASIQSSIDLPFASRMFASREGNTLLYAKAVDQENIFWQEDTLVVWRKQEVLPPGSGFFRFQPDARFDHESYFEKVACKDHWQSACIPQILELVCSDDNNKIAIGWCCRLSENFFCSLIESSILVFCGLEANQVRSKNAFEHILFSSCGTWLAFFRNPVWSGPDKKRETSATLLRFDGAVQHTYNIPGEGQYAAPCFSPDSALFAYTTRERAAFMNLSTLSPQPGSVSQSYSFPPPLGDNRVDSLDFSPQPGKNLLLAVSEGKITFWQFEPDPTCVGILDLTPHAFLQKAVFSNDSSYLMALDKINSNIHFLTPKGNRDGFTLSCAGLGALET